MTDYVIANFTTKTLRYLVQVKNNQSTDGPKAFWSENKKEAARFDLPHADEALVILQALSKTPARIGIIKA
jgi:hypothetical protein